MKVRLTLCSLAVLSAGLWIQPGVVAQKRKAQPRPPEVTLRQTRVSDNQRRVASIKNATVRVKVNGVAAGTGFFIDADGTVLTAFHVVKRIDKVNSSETSISFADNIEIELADRTVIAASPHQSCRNQGFARALANDYCLLVAKPPTKVTYLRLGAFASALGGSSIYLCGFPFGVDQPVVAFGVFSTKWTDAGYLNQAKARDVAWLDITMNRGNSGGPVVLLGESPDDDRVIGIAAFGITPLDKRLEQIIVQVNAFPGRAVITGLDVTAFASLVGESFRSTSVGVGACVSIDYAATSK